MTDAGPADSTESSEPTEPGRGIVLLSMAGTAVFVVLGALADVFMWPFMVVFVVVSMLQFAAGTFVFALAFLRAVDRSRTETIGVGGLFFGSGTTPRPVQIRLMGSLAVQVIASLVIASVHVYTALAFGVLSPMWALGFAGLWVAAHGSFPPREFDPRLDRGTGGRATRAPARGAAPGPRSPHPNE